jgi:hypothetical protein
MKNLNSKKQLIFQSNDRARINLIGWLLADSFTDSHLIALHALYIQAQSRQDQTFAIGKIFTLDKYQKIFKHHNFSEQIEL